MKKITIIFLVLTMIFIFSACSGNDERDRDIATCKGCGKRFYAGDAAGNYMNIAWTNLCNSCEAEAKAYGEIKDYFELNY